MTAIGERIRAERIEAGLTQRQLAESVDVGTPHISKIENGRENPSDALITLIAKRLDVNRDELLLVAGRVPYDIMARLTASPQRAARYLRRFE